MSADHWTSIWTLVLVGGSGSFAVLAVIVAVGGFRDVRAMFRRIDAEHEQAERDDSASGSRSTEDASRG